MEYKLTAKQRGKTIALHYEEESNCEIMLTIGRPTLTGMKIIYESSADRNRVKRKERQSDYGYTSDTMIYYRNLLEAMGIETVVGAGDLSAMSYFLTGKSIVEPVYVPDELTVAYDKLKESTLVCHVTLRQGAGSTAQFYLHEEKLELVVSSAKPSGQSEYDSREDASVPMYGIIPGLADLNYRRHLHYQFMLAKLGIEMSTRDAFNVYEKFIPKVKEIEDRRPNAGGSLMFEITIKEKSYRVAFRKENDDGLHLMVDYRNENNSGWSIAYNSLLDNNRPFSCGRPNGIVAAERIKYFSKKLSKLSILMQPWHWQMVNEKYLEKSASKKTEQTAFHYKGNGWALDFVDQGELGIQLFANAQGTDGTNILVYNSLSDMASPQPIDKASLTAVNASRIQYFKEKLESYQIEMRPGRWQQIFNQFIKGEKPVSNDKEAKVISKRELPLGKFNILVELTEDKYSRVRLVSRDENQVITFTMYDSLRDIRAPVHRTNSLLDHLYACFQYYPTKLAEIDAPAHVDWWYSVYQDFIGYLHNEVHFHGELKFEKPSFRPRNLIAVLLKVAPNYPRGEIVPDEVRDTLKALIEHRCIRITGVVDEKKYFSPREISLQGPSLPNPDRRDVSFFFNEQDGYPVAIFADALKGVEFDFILIEPGPTQKTVVRSWAFTNSYISTFVGVPPVLDLALDLNDRSTEVKYVFNGEQSTSGAVLAMAKQILSAMNIKSANPHIRKL